MMTSFVVLSLQARLEICKCRQLCYLAACMADKKGFKGARKHAPSPNPRAAVSHGERAWVSYCRNVVTGTSR